MAISTTPIFPTHYRIAPRELHAHLFEVSVTVGAPDASGQKFTLPAWIPGSYLAREFARHFVSVQAECNGAAVALVKETKNAWRADPCEGPLTITAHVYAYDLSVRTAYLDSSRGYFNGPSVFLCPVGCEDIPCIVDIQGPDSAACSDWRVATTLPRAGASAFGFGRFRAANYDELIDHPVEMGAFSLASFEAGGAKHDITVTGYRQVDLARLAADLQRVCVWHIELFGGKPNCLAPFDRYLFQVIAVSDGYGGLEHRTSTSLVCRRDDLPLPESSAINDDYLGFLGLASHEYFHAWNIKRIKPEVFAPYDLTQEGYTRQLWAFESITSYYDNLALVRCGLIAPARYLELLGRTITTVMRGHGRLVQSVADSSFDAWIKSYRSDPNTPNAVVSYYAKGSLVALALDLMMRLTGRTSLDHLMRALWGLYGLPGVGVPEDAIPRLASEVLGADLSDFFARYVQGTEDPAIAPLLASFGVMLYMRPAIGPTDRGGRAVKEEDDPPRCAFGMQLGPNLTLQHVYRESPAERAGLSADDTLVALDGLKASETVVLQILRRRSPGDTVKIHVFRRDELKEFSVTLESAPNDTAYLVVDLAPSEEVAARRAAWLGTDGAESFKP